MCGCIYEEELQVKQPDPQPVPRVEVHKALKYKGLFAGFITTTFLLSVGTVFLIMDYVKSHQVVL